MAAGRFDFSESSLTLDIAGEEYAASCAQEDIERILALGEAAVEKTKGGEPLEAAAAICDEAVDIILGEGAAKRIFKGRRTDVFERMELVAFISREVARFRAARLERYSPDRILSP